MKIKIYEDEPAQYSVWEIDEKAGFDFQMKTNRFLIAKEPYLESLLSLLKSKGGTFLEYQTPAEVFHHSPDNKREDVRTYGIGRIWHPRVVLCPYS